MLAKLLSILLVVVCLVQEGEFKSSGPVDSLLFKHVQARINSLSEDKIPGVFKDGPLAKNIDKNWCCKVQLPLLTFQTTKLVSYTVTVPTGQYQCGTEWCWNILEIFQCPVYCTSYGEEIKYETQTYTYSQAQVCPPKEIKCCDGFLSVLGHCFDFMEVQQHLDLIQFLNSHPYAVSMPSAGN